TPFRRLVESTGIGLLVDAENPESASVAVQSAALSDAEGHLRQRLDAMHATRCYDWDEVASRYVDVYRETIGSPNLRETRARREQVVE
ncbi:glycosyltransferase, partial [Acidisoma sp. L85]|uniref:glycosyltransferase n=1 Tax=Acidisoma sp. L85 TaxID=1641850 RepID=UPI00352ABA7C